MKRFTLVAGALVFFLFCLTGLMSLASGYAQSFLFCNQQPELLMESVLVNGEEVPLSLISGMAVPVGAGDVVETFLLLENKNGPLCKKPLTVVFDLYGEGDNFLDYSLQSSSINRLMPLVSTALEPENELTGQQKTIDLELSEAAIVTVSFTAPERKEFNYAFLGVNIANLVPFTTDQIMLNTSQSLDFPPFIIVPFEPPEEEIPPEVEEALKTVPTIPYRPKPRIYVDPQTAGLIALALIVLALVLYIAQRMKLVKMKEKGKVLGVEGREVRRRGKKRRKR